MMQKKAQSKRKRYGVCKRKGGALRVCSRGRESDKCGGREGMSRGGSRIDRRESKERISVGIHRGHDCT